MLDPKNAGGSESSGFKGFNKTGREDTASVVLRPQVDAASRQRYALLIAVAVVLIAVMGYVAFSRSHLSFIPQSDSDSKTFAPGEHSVDSSGQ